MPAAGAVLHASFQVLARLRSAARWSSRGVAGPAFTAGVWGVGFARGGLTPEPTL